MPLRVPNLTLLLRRLAAASALALVATLAFASAGADRAPAAFGAGEAWNAALQRTGPVARFVTWVGAR